MGYNTMAKSLFGEIPGTPEGLIRAKLNEALGKVYDETDWSFQTVRGGWLTPGLVQSVGTVTVTAYSTQVIGNAVATALWTAMVGRPLITELQFRNPSYDLYSIVDFDPIVNAPFATLTLDRPWMEPAVGPGQPYMMYQAYFPVPVSDFRKFLEIRDVTNAAPVSFTDLSQDDLALLDPQRLQFGPCVPTFAVPCGVDQRAESATLGYPMYELWPHVLSKLPYSFSFKRRGDLLVNPSDTAPYPLTEELVMWRAKEVLYMFKEAQRAAGDRGPDFKFLAQAANKEYGECLMKIRKVDANLHRDFVTHQRPGGGNGDGYSTYRTGQLNVGQFGR